MMDRVGITVESVLEDVEIFHKFREDSATVELQLVVQRFPVYAQQYGRFAFVVACLLQGI